MRIDRLVIELRSLSKEGLVYPDGVPVTSLFTWRPPRPCAEDLLRLAGAGARAGQRYPLRAQ